MKLSIFKITQCSIRCLEAKGGGNWWNFLFEDKFSQNFCNVQVHCRRHIFSEFCSNFSSVKEMSLAIQQLFKTVFLIGIKKDWNLADLAPCWNPRFFNALLYTIAYRVCTNSCGNKLYSLKHLWWWWEWPF